jgi:hypothetical protein
MKTWILLLIILSSCSAKYHLRKAIKKDPTLIKQIEVSHTDTLYLSDTITIPGGVDTVVTIDTVFETDRTKVINQGNGKYRIIEKEFTIHHYDTIVREVKVKVDCPQIEDDSLTTQQKIGIGIIIGIILILLLIKWLR